MLAQHKDLGIGFGCRFGKKKSSWLGIGFSSVMITRTILAINPGLRLGTEGPGLTPSTVDFSFIDYGMLIIP